MLLQALFHLSSDVIGSLCSRTCLLLKACTFCPAGAFAAGAFAAGAFGMATASNTAHLGAPLSYAAAAAAVSGAAAFPTFRKQRFSRALSDVLHKADGAAASDGEATELEPATPRAVDVASAGSPSPFTNHYEPPSLLVWHAR